MNRIISEELKPCPFCGGTAREEEAELCTRIACQSCWAEARTPEAWNTRPLAPTSDQNAGENWNSKRKKVSLLVKELQGKPDSEKLGYSVCPGGFLNAYREGDITFDEAVSAIEKWSADQNAGQVGVSTGAEFFPAVDDLTEMIDHWKENTDMDTHDLVEGVMWYFRCKNVRAGRDDAISELIATLNAWDGAWKGKISNKLFDSLVAMIQRLPDLPDNGSPFEISDRGSQFYCTICGNHYWAHNPLDCPKCLSAKASLRTTNTLHNAGEVGIPGNDEICTTNSMINSRIITTLPGISDEKVTELRHGILQALRTTHPHPVHGEPYCTFDEWWARVSPFIHDARSKRQIAERAFKFARTPTKTQPVHGVPSELKEAIKDFLDVIGQAGWSESDAEELTKRILKVLTRQEAKHE